VAWDCCGGDCGVASSASANLSAVSNNSPESVPLQSLCSRGAPTGAAPASMALHNDVP
jgi:hypothetical protein